MFLLFSTTIEAISHEYLKALHIEINYVFMQHTMEWSTFKSSEKKPATTQELRQFTRISFDLDKIS